MPQGGFWQKLEIHKIGKKYMSRSVALKAHQAVSGNFLEIQELKIFAERNNTQFISYNIQLTNHIKITSSAPLTWFSLLNLLI